MTAAPEFKTAPYAHQRQALDLARGKPAFAHLAGVGTGKSKVVIDEAAALYRQGKIDTLVVLAPNGVHNDAWVGDAVTPGLVAQHLPDDIPYRIAFTKGGKPDGGLRALMDPDFQGLTIACVHYEGLVSNELAAAVLRLVKRAKGCMVLADESQKIRSGAAARTRFVWRLGDLATYRRITTGTPTSQGWQDLWAQYVFLDWRIIGCRTFAEFKAAYCEENRFDRQGRMIGKDEPSVQEGGRAARYSKIAGYKHTDQLERRIAPYTFQILKKDCLDLPPQRWVERTVPLSAAQQKAYRAIERDLMLELDNGQLMTAELAVTRILRLQQVVAGHLPDMEGGWTALPGEIPRVEACVDVVAEADGKVIVWARFIPDRRLLAAALEARGIGWAEYAGKDRSANLARWRADPDCRVLLANPVSGGTGLTLVEAPTMVHYSLSFVYEDLEQSEGRNHRPGQRENTLYVTMRCPGTTDDRVIRTLAAKRDVAEALRDSTEIRRFVRGA